MKKSTILTAAIFSAGSLFAQNTAQDWTKTDCDGNTQSLFADYLDQGKVVLMQFDMMNCGFCTSAAYYTDQIYQDYQVSKPGKVFMFSLGYTNSTVCSSMNSWKSSNGFSFPCIEKCPNELAYYGGMGMPTIVVAGNSSHKVYYKKLGFTASDDASIRAAIDQALADATGIENEQAGISTISVFPNPAGKMTYIEYELKQSSDVRIGIYNILGEKIQALESGKQSTGKYRIALNTADFSNGIYVVSLNGSMIRIQVLN